MKSIKTLDKEGYHNWKPVHETTQTDAEINIPKEISSAYEICYVLSDPGLPRYCYVDCKVPLTVRKA